jgi:hypothetical protein
MKDLGTRIAQYQFALSLLVTVCFFAIIGLAVFKMVDAAYVEKVSPIEMLVVMYWFQRQRHSEPAPVPMQPATPAEGVSK